MLESGPGPLKDSDSRFVLRGRLNPSDASPPDAVSLGARALADAFDWEAARIAWEEIGSAARPAHIADPDAVRLPAVAGKLRAGPITAAGLGAVLAGLRPAKRELQRKLDHVRRTLAAAGRVPPPPFRKASTRKTTNARWRTGSA